MSANKLLQAAAGAGGESVYVEDVFSTVVYDGGSAQNFEVGVDMTEGGLLWFKQRSNIQHHALFDSESNSDFNKYLRSEGDNALDNLNDAAHITVDSEGFNLTSTGYNLSNNSGRTYVTWMFRKQAGFFDIVTYTGDGSQPRAINHNLGSVPGFIMVKRTDTTGSWQCRHRSLPNSDRIVLNSTSTAQSNAAFFFGDGTNPVAATATQFTVADDAAVNASGGTYVAYLFAHDDQSFGDNSDESIIKCGSFTNDSASVGVEVNLGWEPQWLLIKGASSGSGLGNWALIDNMRGASVDSQQRLYANASTAEGSSNWFKFTSRGFTPNTYFDGTLIYIAIRRPMKTPEAGTDVFNSLAYTGDGASTRDFDLGMTVDAYFQACRSSSAYDFKNLTARLTGKGLYTAGTGAEFTTNTKLDVQEGLRATAFENTLNQSSETYIINAFKRATGFFDVVAYTGTEVSGRTISHNLGVIPELIICKGRNQSGTDWTTYDSASGATKYMQLNSDAAAGAYTAMWNDTAPTASVFTVGDSATTNGPSNYSYVAYLFATVAGVSKVGSYSGTGSNVDVDCGFSSGARFVLIKRTDSTGDWYVYDSTRGIVAGNDPYLLLNTTAAEVTSTDYIDPLSSGFTVTSSAPAEINTSGGTYIFLAIA